MNLYKYSKAVVVLSSIPAVFYSFFPGKIAVVTALCLFPCLVFLPLSFRTLYRNYKDLFWKNSLYIVTIFFISNIFIVLHGTLNLKDLYDYVDLVTNQLVLALVIPFSIYFGVNNKLFEGAIQGYLKYSFFITLILLITTQDTGPLGFARSMYPILLFLLLVPFIDYKYSFFILAMTAGLVVNFYFQRSVLLNFIATTFIMATYYFRRFKITLISMKLMRYIFLLCPFVSIYLALFHNFNIFQYIEGLDILGNFELSYVDGSGGRDVLVDSRTGIYEDVFFELKKQSAYIFGLGANGKTDTSLFNVDFENYGAIYSNGRPSTESGMLNFIQWGGILGSSVYYYLFWKTSYLAIYKSKNWFFVMLGVWISFKCFYSFIEDILIFGPSTIFLFITIGLSLNSELRMLDNNNFKKYIKSILKIN